MTAKQNALYWSEWQKAKRAARQSGSDLTECERHTIHIEALGPSGTESHKDFSNEDFDKVLALFRAISNPNSINAQLRQIEQRSTRLLKRIQDQLKCLALFLDHPESYVQALLSKRFHVELIIDLGDDSILRLSKSTGEPIDDSELEMFRNTLADRRLSKFRREYIGPNGTFTEHDMCARAGVECFRKGLRRVPAA
jgi:hypothetical protein